MMIGDDATRVRAAARHYRAAAHRFRAALEDHRRRRTEATRDHLAAAQAELDTAKDALLDAALTSDVAEVLLPEPPAEPGAGPVR